MAKAAVTESASVEVGGCMVCGFFTSWGDGAFPVRRDLTADGTLCRVRVEVGAAQIVERQRKLDDRWRKKLQRLPQSARQTEPLLLHGEPAVSAAQLSGKRGAAQGAPSSRPYSWNIMRSLAAGPSSRVRLDCPVDMTAVLLAGIIEFCLRTRWLPVS